MTGFARAEVSGLQRRFVWEVKSVNARGLEVRMRLPGEVERLDPAIRRLARDHLTRGSCFFNLHQDDQKGQARYRVNEDVLALVVSAAIEVAKTEGVAPPTADGLLQVRGVIEESGLFDREMDEAALDKALLGGLSEALIGLRKARAEEGARLGALLSAHLDAMDLLRKEASEICDNSPQIFKTRIAEQVEALIGSGMDQDRLYQEAVLAATKSDVREEVDRLETHIASARALMVSDDAVGRRFDFLAQELNREANTLCSKAFTSRLSAIGIELKALVDQFREQVQNVE